ncbi:MAG: hypothetical protein M1334_03430 [Patescibacteria group bacterium]|nr:hypothetical protein [Patescibacteria group bacterium]
MEGINIKKLIASFLGIAVIATFLILIIPQIIPALPQSSNSNLTILNQLPSASSSLNQAFATQSSSTSDLYNQTLASIQQGSDENLTQVFAQQLAQQIIQNNPGGPVNLNNNSSVLIPSSDQIISEFNNYIQQNNALVIPPPSYQYTIIDSPTAKQNGDYLTSIKDILNQTVLSDAFKNYSSQTITTDNFTNNFSALSLILDQAIQQLAVVPVPKPLLSIHESLIKYLSDQKGIYSQVANYQNDPARAAIVLQAGDLIKDLITKDQEGVQAELSKIKFISQKVSLITQKNSLSDLIDSVFGVNQAQADFSLMGGAAGDAGISSEVTAGASAGLASNLAITVPNSIMADTSFTAIQQTEQATKNTLWNTYIEPVLMNILQIIVQTLIHQLVVQTINWINSGYHGQPFYIQNWQTFLTNAADQAGGAIAEQLDSGACQPFQAALQISQLPVNPALTTSCTLSKIVGNFQQFADDFSNGGWLAYGASLEPQNNFLGASLLIQDQIQNAKIQAAANAAQEAVAGKGFQPSKICVERLDTSYGWTTTTTVNADQISPNDPNCTKTQIVTPGEAIANLSDRALGSDIDQWVNAKDISALVNAFINSAITNLIQAGTKGLNGTTFNYTQPTPLFQQLQIAVTQTGLFDIVTLDKDLAQVTNWLSATKLSLGQIQLVPTGVSNFFSNLDSELTNLTAHTMDLTPTDCKNDIENNQLAPLLTALKQQSAQAMGTPDSTYNKLQIQGIALSNYLNSLRFFDDYYKYNISTSTEPLSPLINTINEQLQIISTSSSTSDPLTFQKRISEAITALNNYYWSYPSSTIAIPSSTKQDDGLISAENAIIAKINSDTNLSTDSQAIAISQITSAAPFIQNNIINPLIDGASNSTSTGLQNIANQLLPIASTLNLAGSASTTLNDVYNQLQPIQNDLTLIPNNPPSISNVSDYQYADQYQTITNDIASTTQIETNLNDYINGLSSDQISKFGLSNLQQYLASSTLAASSTQYEAYYTTLNAASTTEQAQTALDLYGVVDNEVSSVAPMVNTAIYQIQNISSLSGYQNVPQLAMNANSILNQLIQSLTFNQVVQAIFGQANQYSDADTQLSTIANLNCGLKHENLESSGSFLNQIHETWSPPTATFGPWIDVQRFQYIPFICQSLDFANSNCQVSSVTGGARGGRYRIDCKINTIARGAANVLIYYAHLGDPLMTDIVLSNSTSSVTKSFPGGSSIFPVEYNTSDFIESMPTSSMTFANLYENYTGPGEFDSLDFRSVEDILNNLSSSLSQTTGTNLPDISCKN